MPGRIYCQLPLPRCSPKLSIPFDCQHASCRAGRTHDRKPAVCRKGCKEVLTLGTLVCIRCAGLLVGRCDISGKAFTFIDGCYRPVGHVSSNPDDPVPASTATTVTTGQYPFPRNRRSQRTNYLPRKWMLRFDMRSSDYHNLRQT